MSAWRRAHLGLVSGKSCEGTIENVANAKRTYDVLLWGHYFYDMIFTGLPEIPALGRDVFATGLTVTTGGSFTTAVALQRLSISSRWMCEFGSDDASRFVLNAAQHQGLDSSLFQVHDRPVRRISVDYSFTNDRGFISYMDDVPQTSPVAEIIASQPRCLLLSCLHHGSEHTDIAAAAHANDVAIYMDCQTISVTLDTPGVAEALRAVDVFAPNRAEAMELTGESSVEGALSRLSELTQIVVIKSGADGALAASGNERWHVPALPLTPVDTTGAGDCFNAGFLYGYIRGLPMETCLRTGNIVGGLSTLGIGGTTIPSAEVVERYLSHNWA
jgi:sugar/nucleoside kinase (ribokinase family)